MKHRILMVAYACGPEGTGEHWLGWGWAREASRLGEVSLITTPKFRDSLSSQAQTLGIQCHFVSPTGPEGWGRKLRWQREVFRLAKQLHAATPFDLVHQTTFHTFRVPFRCVDLNIPSVWGPIAGGESVPPGFYGILGKSRWTERARAVFNRLCLYHPGVQRSFRKSSRIFVSNRTSLEFFPSRFHAKCRLVPPNASPDTVRQNLPERPVRAAEAPTRLLYVCNCVATRALPLVLEAMRRAGPSCFLKVVGGGPSLEDWKRLARTLGMEAQVQFLGPQPKETLPRFYQEADLLVFPALRDSGGSALLEAMAQGIPVLCFPWGGPAEMVNEETGFLTGLQNPAQTIREIQSVITRLRQDPELGRRKARQAEAWAREHFSWDRKREILSQTYREIVAAK
jgi:glycosyltransferase involved in cell wall biosynthesis